MSVTFAGDLVYTTGGVSMPSMFQLRAVHYLKRTGFLVLFLIIAIGLYFAVQTDFWKNSIAAINSIGQVEDNESVTEPESDSFEAMLDRSSLQQLILRATQLVDEPEISVIDRLDRQDRKRRIAERLITNINSTKRVINIGIQTKLSAMRYRELINFDNGIVDLDSFDELDEFSRKYLASFEVDILRQADLGQMAVQILRELRKSGDDDFSIDSSVLRFFESISQKYVDNIIVAEELFKMLNRIHIHASESDRDRFLEVYTQIFEKSRIEKIRLMVSDVVNELNESEFELTNIFDVIEAQRGRAIVRLREQVMTVIERGYISQYGYYRIYDSIKDVAKAGNYAVALELTELFEDNIRGKATLSRLAAQCLPFKKRLRMVGQILELEGIETDAGEPFRFRRDNAPMKAILFVGTDDFEESNKFLFALTRVVGKDMSKGRFALSVVYANSVDPRGIDSQVEKLGRLVSGVGTGVLNLDSEAGGGLFETMEISDSSLLVLLDSKNRIIGVDIDKNDFEKRYNDLKND